MSASDETPHMQARQVEDRSTVGRLVVQIGPPTSS
jgi:hypothetical protein